MKDIMNTFLIDILGIKPDGGVTSEAAEGDNKMKPFEEAVELLLKMRAKAKASKDWATADALRDKMSEIGFNVKDTKDGFEWSLK